MMNWEQLSEQFMDYSSWMYEAMLFSIVAFVIGFFARIFGKPLVYLWVGGFVADLVKTVILAVVGAVVSFVVSLFLKNLIRRKKR